MSHPPPTIARSTPFEPRLGIPLLILLLAAALRVARLGSAPVSWDEGFSVWIARQPIPALLYQAALDVHPPLYYLILRGWRALAGESALALRVPSVLWGLVGVALIYRLGRLIHSPRAGAIAALIVSCVPLWVAWSQQMRMYTQATALAALALLAALKVLGGHTRRPWLWAAILALAMAAGLLSLFIFAGAIIALNLGAALVILRAVPYPRLPRFAGSTSPLSPFWGEGPGVRALRWGAAQAAALALFLPWYFYSSRQASWQSAQAPIDLGFTVRLYLSVLMAGIEENIDRYGLIVALAALILLGAALVARDSPSPASDREAVAGRGGWGVRAVRWPMLTLGALLPPLLMFGLFLMPRSERFNIAGPSGRYFMVMSVPLYLLLGWGIASAGRRWRFISAAALATVAGLLGWSLVTRYFPQQNALDDYASLASTLEALRQPGDALLLNNDYEWPIFAYHYPGDYLPIAQERIRAAGYAEDLLRPTLDSSRGVWLVQTPFAAESDPDNRVAGVFASRTVAVQHYAFPDAVLWFYALTPDRAAEPAGRATRWPSDFAPAGGVITAGVSLMGRVVQPRAAIAGTLFEVGLGWRVEAGASGQWPVAVRLIGQAGREIAAARVTLAGPAPGDYYLPVSLFIPVDAQAGPARIVLAAGTNNLSLGRVSIQPARAPAAPGPFGSASLPPTASPLAIRFGDHIRLLAADLPPHTIWQPGQSIPLTLYWTTDAPLEQQYKVFTHLVGQKLNPRLGSPLWGQQDQEPGSGLFPTTLWRPGGIVRDAYLIPILRAAPSGDYRLEVGLYLPLDFQNLPAFGPDGRPLGGAATLLTITIRR